MLVTRCIGSRFGRRSTIFRDEADLREAAQTQVVLGQGADRRSCAALALACRRPIRAAPRLAAALRLSAPGLSIKVPASRLLARSGLARSTHASSSGRASARAFRHQSCRGRCDRPRLGRPALQLYRPWPGRVRCADCAFAAGRKIEAAAFVAAISSYRPQPAHALERSRAIGKDQHRPLRARSRLS